MRVAERGAARPLARLDITRHERPSAVNRMKYLLVDFPPGVALRPLSAPRLCPLGAFVSADARAATDLS